MEGITLPTFYHYPLPFNDITKEFRKEIWNTLFENHQLYPGQVLFILKNFRRAYKELIKEILEYDLSFLLPFVELKLDPNIFENIFFVHDFVNWLDGIDLSDRSYRKLKERYYSKEFEYFRKLDLNWLRGKRDYAFEKYEDFQKFKEEELRSSFLLKDESEFEELHKAISNTLSLGDSNSWGIYQSLDIIIEENFNKNNELGFNLFKSILNNYPKGLSPLYRSPTAIEQKSEEWALKLWQTLKSLNNENQIYWQLAFFDCLPKELANEYYKNELIDMFSSFKNHIAYLRFESVEKCLPIDKDIIHKSLKIVVDKIENENLRITISYHFFENYSKFILDDFQLLSKAYIQQEKISSHFDLERNGLKTLVEINQEFLFEYLTHFYTDANWDNRDRYNHLPFIWDLSNYEETLEKAISLILEHNSYFGIGDYSLSILFSHLSEPRQEKAENFIRKYITKNNKDYIKMNAIFDVIRNAFSGSFDAAFSQYLSLNPDIGSFEQIYWRGNGGSYRGDEIIGEIIARDWQRILSVVDKLKNQLELIPIKGYIKKRIEYELKSAEEERKRKFVNPNW